MTFHLIYRVCILSGSDKEKERLCCKMIGKLCLMLPSLLLICRNCNAGLSLIKIDRKENSDMFSSGILVPGLDAVYRQGCLLLKIARCLLRVSTCIQKAGS